MKKKTTKITIFVLLSGILVFGYIYITSIGISSNERFSEVTAKVLQDYARFSADAFIREVEERIDAQGDMLLHQIVPKIFATANSSDAIEACFPQAEGLVKEYFYYDLNKCTVVFCRARMPEHQAFCYLRDELRTKLENPLLSRTRCSKVFTVVNGQPRLWISVVGVSLTNRNTVAVIGAEVNMEYIKTKIFPEVMAKKELLAPYLFLNESPGKNISVAVFDGKGDTVFQSEPQYQSQYTAVANFAEFLPNWKVAVTFKDASTEKLIYDAPKDNRISILLLSLVILPSIALMVVLILREMELVKIHSDFISNVTHELKTPLARIRLFNENLQNKIIRDEERIEQYHTTIDRECVRLTHLIDNVLDFSKIQKGKKQYQFKEVDVRALVRNVLEAFHFQFRQKNFTLTTNIDETVPTVQGDEEALGRAVINLVDNAIKYSNGTKEIAISLHRSNGSVVFAVSDKGIGIPKDEQKKIFKEFYRVESGLSQQVAGSGLGLALVKHIVEAHHGRVHVESEPGEGSTFSFAIPLQQETTADIHEA
jgi:signal transduction histidine kinase